MNPFDLITLLEVLRVQKQLVSFWSRWFPETITFDTAEIAFDKVSSDYRKMAPFVAPNVQGRVQRQAGFSTISYAPAYVKPKDVVRPNIAQRRTAGESLVTGTLSQQQRYDNAVANLLAEQRIKIENRVEWMRAKALIDGKITVEGRDYPKVTIDFGRHASLTTVLTGTARWSDALSTPIKDLSDARRRVSDLSGAVVRDYVFGPSAWALFYAKLPDASKLQNNTLRGSEGTVSSFLDGLEGVEFAGSISGVGGAGEMRFWVYSAKVLDETGALVDILQTDTVVGVSDSVQGVDCYGAIEDLGSLSAIEMYPKMWEEQDPSAMYLMTQSAPLPVPKYANATFSIRVN